MQHTITIDLPDRYEYFFDQNNVMFSERVELNLTMLRGIETLTNAMLRERGQVFLNEVLRELEAPVTQVGAVVGWVWAPGAHVDFGIFGAPNEQVIKECIRNQRDDIPLTFNVQGIIVDKI